MQRINRRLAADGEVLKAARTAKVAASVGHYFVVRGNRIAREHINPEALARELGVLADWERVGSPGLRPIGMQEPASIAGS